jgi:hypothetical protein
MHRLLRGRNPGCQPIEIAGGAQQRSCYCAAEAYEERRPSAEESDQRAVRFSVLSRVPREQHHGQLQQLLDLVVRASGFMTGAQV